MKLRPSAGKIIQENAQGRPDILAFGWSLSTSISETKGMMGLGIPDCVNPQQGRAFLSKVSELRRPFFFVKASYDRYLRASNLGLLFGGFSSTAESLKLSQLAPNGIFQIEIADSDTGQIQLSGQLENCQK